MNKAARKRKFVMWQRYKQTQSYEDLVEFRLARNQAAREYREAKRSFEINLAKEIATNRKSFYSYIRSKKCQGYSWASARQLQTVGNG
jgi:hypothetical protein